MPPTAPIKVTVTDSPQVQAVFRGASDLAERVLEIAGGLRAADHMNAGELAADELVDAVADFSRLVSDAHRATVA